MTFPAATSTSRTAESAPPVARRPEPVRDTAAPTRVEPPAYMGGRTTRTAATAPTTREPPVTRDTSAPVARDTTGPATRDTSDPATRDTSDPVARDTSGRAAAPADPASVTPASAASSAFTAALEQGAYFLNLGPGFTISAGEVAATINLENKPQILPGFRLIQLRFSHRNHGPEGNASVTVEAEITIPHVRKRGGGNVSLSIDQNGTPTFNETLVSDLPVFKNKSLRVSLNDQRQLAAELVIDSTDLMPRASIPNLTISGGGTFLLTEGKLQGLLQADLAYTNLGSGHLNFNFSSEGQASGDGTFTFEPSFLQGATATLAIDEAANLRAQMNIPASNITPPIPGLSVTEGMLTFGMDNGAVSGALAGVKLVYNGLAEATIDADIRRGSFTGGGAFAVTVSELTDVSGRVRFSNGILTGSITIRSTNFPDALHVQSGSITATLTETNDIDLAGEALILLGPAGEGHLRASRENGLITIGTVITLNNIRGLQSAQFTLVFTSAGSVEGEADIAVDDSLIPGLSGALHLTYRDNLWSGETEINFTKEEMSINGTLLVGVRQTEEGTLVFHGSGELSAEVVPGVVGTVGVEIDEDGTVTLNMAFTQTEPWELFEEQRQEREFLNISRNIPVFAAIVVAVIRLRAGVRAGIGPGQIRNTRVEGTWVITSDAPPDLSVSSEFFMPAFVEGYVAFGAGLGVDVLLGSLTGGIEGVATAGLYGAISVVPELSYENGDWLFDGTATLAAGARLKLSLNAWAEVEALWVTVWEESWELASHTMNIGPDLVLRANVAMNLSNPSVPELTFESSDVDADGLIDSAMPADGPPSAGTREALENRAEWAGNSRAAGDDADSVPPELASQANESEPAPAAPPHPSGHSGPPPEVAEGAPPSESPTSASTADAAAVDANAPATVDGPRVLPVPESEIPNVEQPRYPNGITLAMLDEPHVQMPRTAAQEREDLEAAGQVLDLVSRQAEDSSQIASHFERIQQRFQLTFMGYVTSGDDTIIEISINPKLEKHENGIPAKGRGIAGMQTNIVYSSGSIPGSSDSVGIKMEAKVLGPDHPSGSGPRGQDDLMGRVRSDGRSDERYVKGHLLNDQVGGAGLPHNLFPITGRANGEHEALIERKVKAWVDQGYWMRYTVEIQFDDANISDPATKDTNFVKANIVCSGDVIDLDHNPSNKNAFSETIASPLGRPRTTGLSRSVDAPVDASGGPLAVRPEDANAEIEGSTRHGGRYLDYHLKVALGGAISRTSRPRVRTALANTLSESKLDTLLRAYGFSSGATRDISSKLTDQGDISNLTAINDNAANLIQVLNAM